MGKKKSVRRDTYKGHAGSCTIRTRLDNVSVGPAAGVCTCGYGYGVMVKEGGSMREMYSPELRGVMEERVRRRDYAGKGGEKLYGLLRKVLGEEDIDPFLLDCVVQLAPNSVFENVGRDDALKERSFRYVKNRFGPKEVLRRILNYEPSSCLDR